MNLKNKKILVTGGFGFIGNHLIKKLRQTGANVENFDLSEGLDIQNKGQLKKAVKKNFDIIYHLAGFSGVKESNYKKEECFRVNTFSTINLCEFIVKHSPHTKLVISSSRLEYGKPIYLPVDEKHLIAPTSVYGFSKLAATEMALVYHRKNKLDVTIFRTSNVYGPHHGIRFKGYNVINHFIDLARKGEILTIFGDGEQERDYLYIDDLIKAFLLAIAPKSSGKIYNLGFGQGIKFKDMVNLIIKKTGKGSLKFIKWPKEFKEAETGSYISDITKIKKELGFKPKIDFEQGIYKTLELEIRN